jgi:hypothetical protein
VSQALLIIGIVGGIVGIIGFIALALAYIRGAYNKATVEALREEVMDTSRREQRLKEDLASCNSRVDTQGAEIAALREAVTQRAAVEALKEQEQRNHVETVGILTEIRAVLERQAS